MESSAVCLRPWVGRGGQQPFCLAGSECKAFLFFLLFESSCADRVQHSVPLSGPLNQAQRLTLLHRRPTLHTTQLTPSLFFTLSQAFSVSLSRSPFPSHYFFISLFSLVACLLSPSLSLLVLCWPSWQLEIDIYLNQKCDLGSDRILLGHSQEFCLATVKLKQNSVALVRFRQSFVKPQSSSDRILLGYRWENVIELQTTSLQLRTERILAEFCYTFSFTEHFYWLQNREFCCLWSSSRRIFLTTVWSR